MRWTIAVEVRDMAKFKVGEIAILVGATNPRATMLNGDEVEIVGIGPFEDGTWASDGSGRNLGGPSDYEVADKLGNCWFCEEASLRKRRPPEEPADEEFQEVLKNGGWPAALELVGEVEA